jgi:hypothetical protein
MVLFESDVESQAQILEDAEDNLAILPPITITTGSRLLRIRASAPVRCAAATWSVA